MSTAQLLLPQLLRGCAVHASCAHLRNFLTAAVSFASQKSPHWLAAHMSAGVVPYLISVRLYTRTQNEASNPQSYRTCTAPARSFAVVQDVRSALTPRWPPHATDQKSLEAAAVVAAVVVDAREAGTPQPRPRRAEYCTGVSAGGAWVAPLKGEMETSGHMLCTCQTHTVWVMGG